MDGGLRRLAAPGYFVAVLMVVFPLLDFATNVWPLQPFQAVWRYGAVGLFSGFVLTPLLGVLVALVIATAAEQGRALGVVGGLTLALAVAFVLLLVPFLLDAFQLRASVPPEGKPQFDIGIWRAALKYLVVSAALGWLGAAALRAGRQVRRARREPVRDAPVLRPPAERR